MRRTMARSVPTASLPVARSSNRNSGNIAQVPFTLVWLSTASTLARVERGRVPETDSGCGGLEGSVESQPRGASREGHVLTFDSGALVGTSVNFLINSLSNVLTSQWWCRA